MTNPYDATGAERAIFSMTNVDDIRAVLVRYARKHLGADVADVMFRAGRVDAVWAVRLTDDRAVLIKAHRRPVDLTERRATVAAQRTLADAGFPAPRPIADTMEFDGLVLTTETLVVTGSAGDARVPAVRRALARGLAVHVAILGERPEIVASAGLGPAWCRYQEGPWPPAHDPFFDFRETPPELEWLDAYAGEAASRLQHGDQRPRRAGHADWYAGNARFVGADLVGTFDWDLVAGPEPHIAGFSAAAYTDGGSGVQDLPSPDNVRDFLRDYDEARALPFTGAQQEQAAAATAWTLAYNARCQASFLDGDPEPGTALALLTEHADEYLDLRW